MTKAVRVHEFGGPEVLRYEDVDLADPGAGEARVRHTAIALNFADTWYRSGSDHYPVAALPFTPGLEAAGVVEAVGAGVTDIAVGARVVYGAVPLGAYAEARNMAADRLVVLPDTIDDEQAGSSFIKGITAQYLLNRAYRVKPGETILFHAIAGGVGLIACQWAKHLGATVIGTVSSDAKAELARAHGCDFPIVYGREDFTARVKEITDGAGVPVVFDSVGKDTFEGSLDCLIPRGTMIAFGQSSGPVPPFDIHVLADKGSLYLAWTTGRTYNGTRENFVGPAGELFDLIARGVVRIVVNQRYALEDVATAHRDVVHRRTSGATILLP